MQISCWGEIEVIRLQIGSFLQTFPHLLQRIKKCLSLQDMFIYWWNGLPPLSFLFLLIILNDSGWKFHNFEIEIYNENFKVTCHMTGKKPYSKPSPSPRSVNRDLTLFWSKKGHDFPYKFQPIQANSWKILKWSRSISLYFWWKQLLQEVLWTFSL